MTSPLDAVPAPLRRLVGFTAGGVIVYAVLLVAGATLFPSTVESGSTYPVAATLIAGLAAYHLVYRGGYARLYDILR